MTTAAAPPTGCSSTPAFGFDDAAARAPTTWPTSASATSTARPYLQAAPGSDPRLRRRRPRAGQRRARRRGRPRPARRRARATHGLGQVLDIVPNHMAIDRPENRWWWDVLENGPSSAATPATSTSTGTRPRRSCATRCCCRCSATTTAGCSSAGELRARARRRPRFAVRYYDHRLPVAPRVARRRCWPTRPRRARLRRARPSSPTPSARLPPAPPHRPRQRSPSATATRRCCGARWRGCSASEPDVAAAVDAEVGAAQRRRRPPRRAARAPELPPRLLAHGRRGARLPPLLRHRRPWSACASRTTDGVRRHPRAGARAGCATGVVDGLRIDHPDGLRDPARLPRAAARGRARRAGSWSRRSSSRARSCPPTWPVDGTTGYDFLQPRRRPVRRPGGRGAADRRSTPSSPATTADVRRGRRATAKRWCCSDAAGRRRQPADRAAGRACASATAGTATTPAHELREALRELLASLPRLPHLRAGRGGRRRAEPTSAASAAAVGRGRAPPARPRRPSCSSSSADLLLLRRRRRRRERELGAALPAADRPGRWPRASRTPPSTATTACSRSTRWAATPAAFGVAARRLPRGTTPRARRALAGDDARHRRPTTPSAARTCGPASPCCPRSPSEWAAAVRALVERRPRATGRGGWPDRNAEYLLYQTLVGACPLDRRAGRWPTWRRRPRGQGAHVVDRPRRGLRRRPCARFVDGGARRRGVRRRPRARSSRRSSAPGRVNVAGPDAAQADRARACPTSTRAPSCGTSSLVDPDNRRPVDFDAAPRGCWPSVDAARPPRRPGRRRRAALPKLWLIAPGAGRRAPAARRRSAGPAAYRAARGRRAERADHVVGVRARRRRRAWSCPGWCCGLAPAAAGATRRVDAARRARGATCSTGERRGGRRPCRSAELLGAASRSPLLGRATAVT